MKNNDFTNEEWKPVEGFPKYYVSNRGRVYTTKRNRMLKPSVHKQGYLWVKLTEGSKSKCFTIHRMVALAFLPNPDGLATVNHKNGIKTDNKVENLEWNTQKQNNLHSYREGLHPIKITLEEREDIKHLFKTKRYTQARLARMYNVSQTEIWKIINNKFAS